ncbi:DUF423 domain-containing protein [Planctomicrobium sp. SH661]|uniref:DUF423 domain-containing protein n=1 Tax=Planctomicrobium sp. SH661 TaxID=3448124 RepID=UPI003F5C4E38
MTSSPSRHAYFWIQAGAVLGALSVILGAFAAHGLDGFLIAKYGSETRVITGQTIPAAVKYLADFKTAAEYQMYHSLALIAVGLLGLQIPSRALTLAGRAFCLGIFLFSGSLYVLVLSGVRVLGAITPFGGVAFIIGWVALCAAATGRKT